MSVLPRFWAKVVLGVQGPASAGGVKQNALFEHPETPAKPARATYALQLPSVSLGEVLLLAFYQDMTLEQIAAIMDLSVGTVRTHYERGKENFRKLLMKNKLISE